MFLIESLDVKKIDLGYYIHAGYQNLRFSVHTCALCMHVCKYVCNKRTIDRNKLIAKHFVNRFTLIGEFTDKYCGLIF